MKKIKGFIIDRGLSPIDGQPYVAILTLKSTNRKTGDMAQVWILREDINPVDAVKSGKDVSICGNCPHRRKQVWDAKRKRFKWVRSCYVNVGQGPNSIFKAYKRGAYTELDYVGSKDLPSNGTFYSVIESIIQGRRIRWGSYGDPSILNPQVVNLFNSYAQGHTGYTHQWREEFASPFKGIFQASCDGFNDYLEATAHGWKTFVVVNKNVTPIYAKQCPATVDNSEAQCITCKLCDGAKRDIFVHAHGTGSKYVTAA
jgi:hypothetical protein